MSKIEDFLTAEEEQEIINAIRVAEQNTSGEIRVHLERICEMDIFEHTKEVFHYLKMDNTKLRNGVLIYIAVDNRSFVIFGDEGINNVVDNTFWETTKDVMVSHFKKGEFKLGIIKGIQEAGRQLETHFPWHHGDIDELPNTISKG